MSNLLLNLPEFSEGFFHTWATLFIEAILHSTLTKVIFKAHFSTFSTIYTCSITATKKVKHFQRTNRIAEYVYYHCTKKNKNVQCSQQPIKESDFKEQINHYLGELKPDPAFVDWAKKWMKELHKQESSTQEVILASQQDASLSVEKKLNKLLDAYLEEKVTEEVYQHKKKELERERHLVEEKLGQTKKDSSDNRAKVETALEFALLAQQKFNEGDRDAKRFIITAIGSNFMLKDGKVRIDLHKHFSVLSDKENWEEKYKGWIEPQKYTDLLEKSPELRPSNPTWLPAVEEIRKCFI